MGMVQNEHLDEEWVELILAALRAGISPENIRDFFQSHSNRKH